MEILLDIVIENVAVKSNEPERFKSLRGFSLLESSTRPRHRVTLDDKPTYLLRETCSRSSFYREHYIVSLDRNSREKPKTRLCATLFTRMH